MWEKQVLTQCSPQYGLYYENFEEAKEACKKDSHCAALFDSWCDDIGFRLCPSGYTEKASSASCLHIKPGGTVIIIIIKTNVLQRYRNFDGTLHIFFEYSKGF